MIKYSVSTKLISEGRPSIMLEQYLKARGLIAEVNERMGVYTVKTVLLAVDEEEAIDRLEKFIEGGRQDLMCLASCAVQMQHK